VGIDQLASSIKRIAAVSADEVAAREAAAAWQRLTVSDRAGSIISSVVDRAEQTVDEEVDRYISRLATASDPERVLRQLARSVARRILHPSVSYVGSTPLEQRDLDVVARAFGVERD
jgi:glutamyl-tRNA reductase